ncbi:MAG TPA: DNA-directed RNA polymerase subunit RpoH/Rpb5 C-terminal domain-containing protein [Candidatus Norongarragalinales archaeon]|nr:DNA-directed RNA polymerase subunit RpoH/Rpb5 C-terminal domain-containing protein [Candidatus Norongarragalinales archaeon]
MDSAFTHYLVPKIAKMDEKETVELLEKMHCTKEQLPLITFSDAGLKGIEVSVGDVVKIAHDEKKKEFYYRIVVED